MTISLASAIFWIAALCFLVAEVAIIRSAIAARGKAAATSTLPPARYGEDVAWAVLPAVGLAVVMLLTWRAIQERERAGAASPAPMLFSPVISTAPIVSRPVTSTALRSPFPVPRSPL